MARKKSAAKRSEKPVFGTESEVRACLKKIRALANEGDFEAAHALQDSLFEGALRYMAETGGFWNEEGRLARCALRALAIKFPRSCA